MTIKSAFNDVFNSLNKLHRHGNIITTNEDIEVVRSQLLAEEIAQKNESCRKSVLPKKQDESLLPLKPVLDTSQLQDLPSKSKKLVVPNVTTHVYNEEVYNASHLSTAFLLGGCFRHCHWMVCFSNKIDS